MLKIKVDWGDGGGTTTTTPAIYSEHIDRMTFQLQNYVFSLFIL